MSGHTVAFLEEAARYFENRPTGGEDRAHWANVFNAKNCRDANAQIEALLALAHQYASDLRYPPTADSITRRLAAIEAVLAKLEI